MLIFDAEVFFGYNRVLSDIDIKTFLKSLNTPFLITLSDKVGLDEELEEFEDRIFTYSTDKSSELCDYLTQNHQAMLNAGKIKYFRYLYDGANEFHLKDKVATYFVDQNSFKSTHNNIVVLNSFEQMKYMIDDNQFNKKNSFIAFDLDGTITFEPRDSLNKVINYVFSSMKKQQVDVERCYVLSGDLNSVFEKDIERIKDIIFRLSLSLKSNDPFQMFDLTKDIPEFSLKIEEAVSKQIDYLLKVAETSKSKLFEQPLNREISKNFYDNELDLRHNIKQAPWKFYSELRILKNGNNKKTLAMIEKDLFQNFRIFERSLRSSEQEYFERFFPDVDKVLKDLPGYWEAKFHDGILDVFRSLKDEKIVILTDNTYEQYILDVCKKIKEETGVEILAVVSRGGMEGKKSKQNPDAKFFSYLFGKLNQDPNKSEIVMVGNNVADMNFLASEDLGNEYRGICVNVKQADIDRFEEDVKIDKMHYTFAHIGEIPEFIASAKRHFNTPLLLRRNTCPANLKY